MYNPKAPRPSVDLAAELRDFVSGEKFYNALLLKIKEIRKGLGKDQQLEMYCYSPGGETIQVTNISFEKPSLFVLEGRNLIGEEVTVLINGNALQLYTKIRSGENPSGEWLPDIIGEAEGGRRS